MDLNNIFPEKQPPPGGLFRLREKLEKNGNKRAQRHWMTWSIAGVLGVLALALIWFGPKKPDSSLILLDGMDLLTHSPQQSQNLQSPGLLKLKETENVVYYQVIQTKGH